MNVLLIPTTPFSPLAASGTYTGIFFEVYQYNSILVTMYSDVSGKLYVDFSSDGVNINDTDEYLISGNSPEENWIPLKGRYMRLRYVNDGTDQTVARLQVIGSSDTTAANFASGSGASGSLVPEFTLKTTKGTIVTSTYAQTFSSNTHLGLQSNMTTTTSGSGAIVSPTQNSPWLGLQVTTASGDKAAYQSKNYMRYWAYRTHKVTFAVSFDTAKTNQSQRAGMFDANDGWFFEYDENGLSVVHRTSTSGSPVDTKVARANFNIDKLDGNGPSGLFAGGGFHLDRGLTLGIDYNWYGTQVIRFFLAYGGEVVFLHQFVFTGQIVGLPFSRSAMLPIKFEVENTGTASAGSTMRVGTCSHAVADDASIDVFYQFSASNGTTAIAATSTTVWQDLLAIRPKSTHNSIENRALLAISHWQLQANTGAIEYRIIDNVTYTGGTWTPVDSSSVAEYSVSPGTQAGTPRVIDVNYLFADRNTGGETPENIANNNIRLGLDTVTGAQYCYVIQARKTSATDSDVLAAITWKEEY